MAYQLLDSFSKNWIFKREDPKVEAADLAQIRLLDEARASNIWRDYISDSQIHPDHFTDNDWIKGQSAVQVKWENVWESESACLPEDILEHVAAWGDDTLVFFCCNNELVFELPWAVFKRSWKAFLFLDNGPILVAKKKKQAVQFHSSGMASLLLRA